MATGARMPTWRERENNRRRERRRRAIAAKIYAGLRMYGNYELPKHCDNNEVLKAICAEAGWTVEQDGTTYRKGCKPAERMEAVGGSASASQYSSYLPSPCISYNPSPASSSFPSPASSSYAPNGNAHTDPNFLIPWFKNLSSSSSASSSKQPPPLDLHFGSNSAPVTPPSSSPTARSPRMKTDWGRPPYSFFHSSTPSSPGRQIIPDSSWFAGLRLPTGGSASPTYSLVSPNPFGFKDEAMPAGGSRMWTPGQSGTCSPAVTGARTPADIQTVDVNVDDFAFGSNATGLVKPWEGERIHEECGSDELELTLGSSYTR